MRIKSKIFFLLLLGLIIGCRDMSLSQETQFEKAKEFSKKFNNLPYDKFINWDISQRQDSLFILDYYKENKYIGGFLIKEENGHLIKRKSSESNADVFVKFEDYPEIKFSEIGITKNEVLEIVNLLKKIKASRVSYVNSFDGVLIEKQNFSIIYLLSNKLSNKLPKSYKYIGMNWYYLSSY
ncbi:hypothetical protein ACNQGB_02265 [Flavobacterium sp. XS1P32]|uniref:hypothetical protein n=1 Tax=Flavobacterium sp. XS1P32 TaxID=3401726 RepID=UPI003AAE92AF